MRGSDVKPHNRRKSPSQGAETKKRSYLSILKTFDKYRSRVAQLMFELQDAESELTRYKQILHASPDPIMIMKPDYQIVYVNPAWEYLTGYTYAEAVYKYPTLLNSDKTPPEVLEQLETSLRDGRFFITEDIINKKKDGSTYQIHATTFAIAKNGDPQYLVQIQHDITARKRLEVLKSHFLSMVTHELKTPLTTITLLMEKNLLQNQRSSQVTVARNELTLIKRELSRLTFLIEDLLDNQRIETGKFAIRPEKISLSKFMTDVVHKLQLISPNHNITLSIKKNLRIYADPQRLEQVIINLVTNAVKYSPRGSTIRITISQRLNFCTITVADKGKGIAKKHLSHIFDQFYQIDERAGGFGLGLYITKQLIELHHGNIQVSSTLKKGSTFKIFLPLS